MSRSFPIDLPEEVWKALAEAQEALPEPAVIKMYCDHGEIPPSGCRACYECNPKNWNPL